MIGPELLALPTAGDVPPRARPGRARAAAVLERHDRAAEGRRCSRTATWSPRSRQMRARARPARERDVVLARAAVLPRDGVRRHARRAARRRRDRGHARRASGPAPLIERHRVTVLAVPPPLMAALAHARERRPLPSLELIVSGGAPLGAGAPGGRSPRASRTPPSRQGYGMTETAVAISGPDRRRATPPGSVGRPMAGTEVQDRRRRAVGPRPAGDGRLPQRRGRLPARRRLAAHRRPRPHRRRRQPLHRRPPQGADQGQRARRSRPPSSRRSCSPTRTSPTPPSSAAPTRAPARSPVAFVVRRPSTPTTLHRLGRRARRAPQAPRGRRRSSTRSPRTPSGKILRARARRTASADRRAALRR